MQSRQCLLCNCACLYFALATPNKLDTWVVHERAHSCVFPEKPIEVLDVVEFDNFDIFVQPVRNLQVDAFGDENEDGLFTHAKTVCVGPCKVCIVVVDGPERGVAKVEAPYQVSDLNREGEDAGC